MTIAELNERAEKILSETLEGLAVLERRMLDGKHEFSPATDPADCAVVMEVMRSMGWRLRGLSDNADEWWHALYAKGPHIATADEHTWTHAVTLAAVRATEGESK